MSGTCYFPVIGGYKEDLPPFSKSDKHHHLPHTGIRTEDGPGGSGDERGQVLKCPVRGQLQDPPSVNQDFFQTSSDNISESVDMLHSNTTVAVW